ncbi:uncharacterized protein LOC111138016 [Crassostrea virginica]
MKTASLWTLGFILQFTFAYLDNNIIRIVSSVGPCSCKLECFSSSDCASVYYDWQHFNCELSSSNESLTEFNASSSYHFSSMDDIKEEFSDPCSGVRCGPHEKCVSTNNAIECVITECGEPDFPCTLTNPTSLRAVGTVLDYYCENLETPNGKFISKCRSDGLWSNLTESYDCPESFDHDVANHLCILVFLDVKTWDDADQVCQNYSQRLVNINTPAQVNILKEYLRSLGTLENQDDVYVGGRLINSNYIWMVTNETIDSNVWDTEYPSDMKTCTYLHDTHNLRDVDCTKSYKYACGAFY